MNKEQGDHMEEETRKAEEWLNSSDKLKVFNFVENLSTKQNRDQEIIANKLLRKQLDSVLQDVKTCPKSRERELAITNLQQSIMWLGMDLKRLKNENPYPQSYNPNSTEIANTADGLKF